MKNYKFYIFDFDGTLVNSYFSMIDIFKHAFEMIGETCTEEQTKRYMRGSLKHVIEERKIEGANLTLFIQGIFEGLNDPAITINTVPYDETLEILANLRKNNAKMGIVTGNNVNHVREILKSKNMDSYFDAIVGSDNCKTPKPEAEPLLMCIDMVPGFDKKDICYIGDSKNDYLCAVNAGVDGYLLDRENEYSDFDGPKITNLRELIINL